MLTGDSNQDITQKAAVPDMASLTAFAQALVKAMKEPDDETKKKQADDRERLLANERMMHEEHKRNEEIRKAIQASCRHTQDQGRSDKPAVVGQPHNDGMVRPICLVCGKEFNPFKATQQMMLEGITFIRVPAA